MAAGEGAAGTEDPTSFITLWTKLVSCCQRELGRPILISASFRIEKTKINSEFYQNRAKNNSSELREQRLKLVKDKMFGEKEKNNRSIES